jgi:hypothetical protein
MARVPDPPGLVKTLAEIRRQLRRIPAGHPSRAFNFEWAVIAAQAAADDATNTPLGETLTTPEDTLHDAGIDDARQATYQRKFSTLLAGRAKGGA